MFFLNRRKQTMDIFSKMQHVFSKEYTCYIQSNWPLILLTFQKECCVYLLRIRYALLVMNAVKIEKKNQKKQ